MIKEDHLPKTLQRNGCKEVCNAGNAVSITFKTPIRNPRRHAEAVNHLIQQCRDLAHEYPACVIQYKNRDFYEREGYMEQTVLYWRHLDDNADGRILTRHTFHLHRPCPE